MKREIVKTVDRDGKPLELAVIRPGHKIAQECDMAYNLKISELIRSDTSNGQRLLLRSEVEDHLIKNGVWTHKDALTMEKLGLRIRALELMIKKGGIKLSEARKLAIEMGDLRNQILELYSKRQQLDSATVESFAENYKFGIMMTKCVVYADTGKPFFVNYDDYMEKGDQVAAMDTAKVLAGIVYGLEKNTKMSLFENKWLKEHHFIDDSGRYIDKDNSFVDQIGKKVDENGRYINEDGNYVDVNNVRLTPDGDFLIENVRPFLDDDGDPIILKTKTKTKPKMKKKRAKKKNVK